MFDLNFKFSKYFEKHPTSFENAPPAAPNTSRINPPQNDILFFSGLGILVYGFAYLFVHDIFIHRRIKIFSKPKNAYLRAVLFEHRKHHASQTKEDGEFFGMLFVKPETIRKFSSKNG